MFYAEGLVIRMTRGDTGIIGFRPEPEIGEGDRAILTVKQEKIKKPVMEMVSQADEDGAVRFALRPEDTAGLREGTYEWDVRFVLGAQEDADGRITGGREVITPYPPNRFIIERAVGRIE